MKALNIGLSSLVMTSLVFAVACADNKRGFKANQITPEEAHRYAAEMERKKPGSTRGLKLPPLPGAEAAPGAPAPSREAGTPSASVVPAPAPAAPVGAPELAADNADGASDFAVTVGGADKVAGVAESRDAGTPAPLGTLLKPAPVEDAQALANAAAKITEIQTAAERKRPADRVFKGISARLKVEGAGAESRLALGVDAVVEIRVNDEPVTVYVSGKASLLPENQVGEKRIVELELNALDIKTGQVRELKAAEFFAGCVSSSADAKDCKRVTLLLLLTASAQNKIAVINTYEVDLESQDGLMVWVEGNQRKSFERAKTEVELALRDAAKPADAAKPSDAKPADAKPAAVAKPADTKPTVAKPVDAKPAAALPAATAAGAPTVVAPPKAPETKPWYKNMLDEAARNRAAVRYNVLASPGGVAPAATTTEQEMANLKPGQRTPRYLTVDLEQNFFLRLKYQKCIKNNDCAELEKSGEITPNIPELPVAMDKYRVVVDLNASEATRIEASNCVRFYLDMYCGNKRLFKD